MHGDHPGCLNMFIYFFFPKLTKRAITHHYTKLSGCICSCDIINIVISFSFDFSFFSFWPPKHTPPRTPPRVIFMSWQHPDNKLPFKLFYEFSSYIKELLHHSVLSGERDGWWIDGWMDARHFEWVRHELHLIFLIYLLSFSHFAISSLALLLKTRQRDAKQEQLKQSNCNKWDICPQSSSKWISINY